MIQLFLQVATASAVLVGGPDGPTRRAEAPEPGLEIRYDGSRAEVEIATPAIASADIDVDGIIDEAAWSRAAVLDGFTQFDPIEGVSASQRTEILVFVDSESLLIRPVTPETFRRDGCTRFYRKPGGIHPGMTRHCAWHRTARRLLGVEGDDPLPWGETALQWFLSHPRK